MELIQVHPACVSWVTTIPTQWCTTNLSSHHCIGFPWSCLSIGKNTSIIALKCRFKHNSSKIFEYLQMCTESLQCMYHGLTFNKLLRAHTGMNICLLQCAPYLFLWNKMTITGIHWPVGVVILKLFGVISCLTDCYTADSLKFAYTQIHDVTCSDLWSLNDCGIKPMNTDNPYLKQLSTSATHADTQLRIKVNLPTKFNNISSYMNEHFNTEALNP